MDRLPVGSALEIGPAGAAPIRFAGLAIEAVAAASIAAIISALLAATVGLANGFANSGR